MSALAVPNDYYDLSSDDEKALNPAAELLLARITDLLEEVEAFQRALRRQKLEKTVEVRLFLNQVKAEFRFIQGLTLESPGSAKSKQGVRASNLPFLEAVWRSAKSTSGIVAISKRVTYTLPAHKSDNDEDNETSDQKKRKQKHSVTVDVAAQNGLQWIKVSLLNPNRLLFELAKAGWEDSERPSKVNVEDLDETYDYDENISAFATSSTSLCNLAINMQLAASQTYVQYLHPRIHFILPNFPSSPSTPVYRSFLQTLVSHDITVHCGNSCTSPSIIRPPVSIPTLINELSSPLRRRNMPLTPTLNLDTTILLALISDISHSANIPHEARFHPAIVRQLEQEQQQPVISELILPIVASHFLICSLSARKRFDEIVNLIASATERRRAAILFEQLDGESGHAQNNGPEEQLGRFEEQSIHRMTGLRLPVRTVPDEIADSENGDSSELVRVAGRLSGVNRGTIITGWKRGLTTITSNRAVTKLVEGCIRDGEVGPDVFVVLTSRSLVGKAKTICDVKNLE